MNANQTKDKRKPMATRRPTTEGKDPAIVWAEKLWKQLHTSLFSTQTTIIEIIKARAWEPLGYESFAKAWVDKMSDISIRVELVPHVVYELLNEEDMTVEDIADIVKGIGPETVENFAREKDNGVPPGQASGRKPLRKSGKDATVFVHPGPERKARWEAAAARLDMSLGEFIIAVTDAACDAS